MKLFKIVTMLFLFLLLTVESQAQIRMDVNIGTPPVWGPVVTTERYYFLPEIDTYYDIRNSQYLTLRNGNWIRTRNVPNRYRNYNFNSGQVIVLNDYNGRSPFVNFKNHKVKYNKGGKKWNPYNGNNGNRGNKGKGNKGNGKN